jgi:hypothetical protein
MCDDTKDTLYFLSATVLLEFAVSLEKFVERPVPGKIKILIPAASGRGSDGMGSYSFDCLRQTQKGTKEKISRCRIPLHNIAQRAKK